MVRQYTVCIVPYSVLLLRTVASSTCLFSLCPTVSSQPRIKFTPRSILTVAFLLHPNILPFFTSFDFVLTPLPPLSLPFPPSHSFSFLLTHPHSSRLIMSMCPYKWFLYLASIWAVLYVMLEAWMQFRAANTHKPGYEPHVALPPSQHLEKDEEEEEDEEDESNPLHSQMQIDHTNTTSSRKHIVSLRPHTASVTALR